ncbi:hypothetical protein OSTOST_24531, partial [Ostertagia ostertagi]
RKKDPTSEEDYWDTIKAEKVQIPVQITSHGEVNSPPSGPYLKVVCISDTHDQLDLVQTAASPMKKDSLLNEELDSSLSQNHEGS